MAYDCVKSIAHEGTCICPLVGQLYGGRVGGIAGQCAANACTECLGENPSTSGQCAANACTECFRGKPIYISPYV